MPRKSMHPSKNLATYSYTTGLYHNSSGTFLTLSEANAYAWKCEKCGLGFRNLGALHNHRDAVHSY